MTDQLKRTYHGKTITSTPNQGFVPNSDGWTHSVDGQDFKTLGEAIAHVRSDKPDIQSDSASSIAEDLSAVQGPE